MANPIAEVERFSASMRPTSSGSVSGYFAVGTDRYEFDLGSGVGIRDAALRTLTLHGDYTATIPRVVDVVAYVVRGDQVEEFLLELSNLKDQVALTFEDGTVAQLGIPIDNPDRDAPENLGGPIDVEEYANLESLIGELRQLIETAEVSDVNRIGGEAVLRVLVDAHRDAEPGKTTRAQLWWTTRNTIRYLWKEFPRDAISWATLITLTSGWWPNLSRYIEMLQ